MFYEVIVNLIKTLLNGRKSSCSRVTLIIVLNYKCTKIMLKLKLKYSVFVTIISRWKALKTSFLVALEQLGGQICITQMLKSKLK